MLNDVELGDLIRVRGLVTPFGSAPEDFTARTVIDIETSRRAGELKVVWPGDAPSTTPFIATSPTTIDVDISESEEWLRVRGIPRFITNPLEMLTIAATESGEGVYAVHVRGSGVVTAYRNFADLVDALNAELEAGNALQRITARVDLLPTSTSRRGAAARRATGCSPLSRRSATTKVRGPTWQRCNPVLPRMSPSNAQ